MKAVKLAKKLKTGFMLGIGIVMCLAMTACGAQDRADSSKSASTADTEVQSGVSSDDSGSSGNEAKRIKVADEQGHEIIFELNSGTAAESLYAQLPLTIEVQDYSDNEKIFYPDALDTSNAPLAENAVGTLAYYAPWKDVVMFYGEFNKNSSLFELGHAVQGAEMIKELSGSIKIEAVE